ncbi:MAG TPA: hypothetical protein VKA50_10175 [Gammaproteobacteria bacterium]|nr:hypothetical protein [Gammaproteobacteria bacterium]
MTEYDNRGQVALWKADSDNPKAPAAKGSVVAHRDIKEGETVEIALWRNDSENPKAPLMKGKISDKRKDGQQDGSQQKAAPPADDLDDDIPF